MKISLAEQLFTVFLRGILEAHFTEQKVLMSLLNLHKTVCHQITPSGNPILRIQHDSFNAIILFDDSTQQISSAMIRLDAELFADMMLYARGQQWPKEMLRMSEDIPVEWVQDGSGLNHRLVLKPSPDMVEEASVAFFDYPGVFDAHTVHFRRIIMTQ
jgi:hypothetical protein